MRKLLAIYLILSTGIAFSSGCRLLLVTRDMFVPYLIEYSGFKDRTGYKTHILIIPDDITTHINIKEEITAYCDSVDTIPEYILFIGSDRILHMGYQEGATSDCYYAELTGDGLNDMIPSRFPCGSTSQLVNIITKTLNYQINPAPSGDSLWLKKASFLCTYEDESSYLTYGRCLYHIDSLLIGEDFSRCDTLISNLGATSGDVINAIDDGRMFVMYRGTGVDGFDGFWELEPYECSNSYKTPIISGTTCATIPNYGPAWLNDDEGAVAYIGSNTVFHGPNLSLQRNAMAIGFADGFVSGMTTGQSTELGREYILGIDDYLSQREYNSLHLLGDPTMHVWTDYPHTLEVTHTPFYTLGSSSIDFDITYMDEPVESALVCIMVDGYLHKYGYSDSDGYISLAYNYSGSGIDSMSIAVTAHNFIPYMSYIDCTISGPRPHISNINFDDSVLGDNDGFLSRNEEFSVGFELLNAGTETAINTRVTAISHTPWITTENDTIEVASILAGTRLIAPDSLEFTVENSAVFGESGEIEFVILIGDESYNYLWTTPYIVGAKLELELITIKDDSPFGNGNSIAEGGENLISYIKLKNSGGASAYDIRCIASYSDILYMPDRGHYQSHLENGDSIIYPLVLWANPNHTESDSIPIVFSITALDAASSEMSGLDTIIIPFETTYNTVTGPDDYGYYIYDNLDISSSNAPIYEEYDITSTGTNCHRLSDAANLTLAYPIPFEFSFYGHTYEYLSISTEGYISPGTIGIIDNWYRVLPFSGSGYPIIAPAWGNNSPIAGGEIFYQYFPDDGLFIIQYEDIYDPWGENLSFTVVIKDIEHGESETDNEIFINYESFGNPINKGMAIQDYTGRIGLTYSAGELLFPGANYIESGSALRITTIPPSFENNSWLIVSMYNAEEYSNCDFDGNFEDNEEISFRFTFKNKSHLRTDSSICILRSTDDDSYTITDSIYSIEELAPEESFEIENSFKIRLNDICERTHIFAELHIISSESHSVFPITIPVKEERNILEDYFIPENTSIINIFPNPFNSCMNVKINNSRNEYSEFKLFSISGKVLYSQIIHEENSELTIDMTTQESGVYLYSISSGKKVFYGKAILIK